MVDGSPAGKTVVFNMDYSRVDALTAVEKDLRAATLRLEYIGAFTDAVKPFASSRWSVSIAGEKTWNAPEAARKSEAVLGAKLEVPVADNITVPFSLRWSNRNELLQDEDEIVGHVGISIDLEAFFTPGKS
jgi:hypothetical protein